MIDVVRRERVVHLVINAPPVNVLDRALLDEVARRFEASASAHRDCAGGHEFRLCL